MTVWKQFLFVLMATLIACSGQTDLKSPEGTLAAFDKAIESENKQEAQKQCTNEFWMSERDSGQRIFKQGTRKKFKLKQSGVLVKDNKAVVTADVIIDGKVKDQLYFYAIQKQDRWLFDGMDESKKHIDLYMNGTLPARFYPEDYPTNPELQKIGEKLANIALALQEADSDPDKQALLLKDTFIGDPKYIYSQLRILRQNSDQNLMVKSTHIVDSIKRGAIVIVDDQGRDQAVIYAKKEGDGWRLIVCHTCCLNGEVILR